MEKKVFFQETSLILEYSVEDKYIFSTLVSYLYSLFKETSEKNLDYIEGKSSMKGVNSQSSVKDFRKTIIAFRTLLQHNLKGSDNEIKLYCDSWIQKASNSNFPQTFSEKNQIVLRCLFFEVLDYFDYIISILKCIEALNESIKEAIIEEWNKVCYRNYSQYDWEKIVKVVCTNFGYEINALEFAKKKFQKWNKEIMALNESFKFEREAERIVQSEFIKDDLQIITGKDVKERYGIEGERIGNILRKAREITQSGNFRRKDEILCELDKFVNL